MAALDGAENICASRELDESEFYCDRPGQYEVGQMSGIVSYLKYFSFTVVIDTYLSILG